MPTAIATTYVTDLQVANDGSGSFTITYNTALGKIPELGGDNTLVMVPSFGNGAVRWECSSGTVLPKYRPARCRN